MIKLLDKQDRNVLGEGRNYQMGFAFLKKRARLQSYETVQPISPCKDYLNDVVYSEHTGSDIEAYGLNYSKKGIFDDTRAYMVISIMPRFSGEEYPNMNADITNLKKNLENLQTFINFFDKALNLELSTLQVIEDNKYLVIFDKNWCSSTWAISMYSLLIRIGQFYKGKNPMDYIEKFDAFQPDVYLVLQALPKIKKILAAKKLPTQDLKSMKPNTNTHNCGILAYPL